MGEIHILAAITVKQEFRADLLDLMRTVVAESRKEPGCVRYDLVEDLADPLSFTVVETWKSRQAIDEHNATPHFALLGPFFRKSGGTLDVKLFTQVY